MGQWSQKMRALLTTLLLGLSWHYVVLASHLACDTHINCEGDLSHAFGVAEADDHEHCLVQLKPSRISEDNGKGHLDCGPADFIAIKSYARPSLSLLPVQRFLSLPFRSIANIHFTESVRMIS